MIGEAITAVFMTLGIAAGGAGIYAAIQDEKQRLVAEEIDRANTPATGNIWGNVDTTSPRNYSSVEPVYESPKVHPAVDAYYRKLEQQALAETDPETGMWTPPQTDEGTLPGTGMPTRETHIEPMVQPFQRNGSSVVQGPVHESVQRGGSDDTERVILECGPYKLDPDDEDTIDAVSMALSIDKSQNWILKNIFPSVSKGGNADYQIFKQIMEKANG